jgi:glycosyltransferase involved in cell wall biosynthesis
LIGYICVMQLQFSFIIPVFNRPDEIQELLQSFTELKTNEDYEIVIVEDGSTTSSKEVVESFNNKLHISYFFKENSGPGDSRNYGMKHAKGNYFIILDSDCILPSNYLEEVTKSLKSDYVDCFGGPDTAHKSFTNLQKAINFSMTSFITTGGIRGNKNSVNRFQPRSFNMGISKKAFEDSKGFGRIHPGEDPDLTIRLWNLGYKTKLIPKAVVFHKRRISWQKFYKQVYKFGMARPILNLWHPSTKKITYWFPSLFCFGFFAAMVLFLINIKWVLLVFILYFIIAFILALISTKNLLVSLLSLLAILVQFIGYGYGFLKSTILLKISNKNPETIFPELFFKLK